MLMHAPGVAALLPPHDGRPDPGAFRAGTYAGTGMRSITGPIRSSKLAR
jgi:hypothetical protein